MYYCNDQGSCPWRNFLCPSAADWLRDNRWVRLAGLMPWEYIEEIYAQNMGGETGRTAISSQIAFGAIFIKEYCHITDEDTVAQTMGMSRRSRPAARERVRLITERAVKGKQTQYVQKEGAPPEKEPGEFDFGCNGGACRHQVSHRH